MTRLGADPVRLDPAPSDPVRAGALSTRRDDRRATASARVAERHDLLLRRLAPVVVLVVAAAVRLWNLGFPRALVFDETFYVKDAWTLWHRGYEATWAPTFTDALFAAGKVNLYTTTAAYVAHPPLGKWIIGLGEVLSGGAQNSAGWRLGTAVAGVVAVGLVMVLAHRLFATPLVTAIAGGLFAIDNQAIVLSRVALLDNFVMLFALVAVICLVEDRFWAERRMGAWLMDRAGPGGWGPAMVWRPWLIAAGLATGFCCAVKWSGIYFLVFFVAYSLLVDMMLRRRAGVHAWYSATLLKQGWATLVSLVPTFLIAYLVSWSGWFATTGGYDRDYLKTPGAHAFTGFMSWVPAPIQDLWAWHASIYAFHVGLDVSHPYNAPARLWLLIARPTSMWWNTDLFAGKQGCPSGQCAGAISDLPNPLIWYAAVAAAIYLLVRFIRKHEWQAGLLLMGIGAGYLPWLLYPNRTMFFFYSIAFEPYLVLCLAATIGLMVVAPAAPDGLGDAVIRDQRRSVRLRRRLVIGFLGLAVVVSAFYYPLSTGIPEPYWLWHIHMWSPTWI